MATLLEVRTPNGVRRCDASCHRATGRRCNCVCGGRFHGRPREAARLLADLEALAELRAAFVLGGDETMQLGLGHG